MTDANPLMAQPEAPKWDDGMGIVDSGVSLFGDDIGKAADGEWDVFALAVDGIAFGIDAISMYMDPLGEVIKVGVGWLLEHLDLLREPLEVLTGDHRAIQAVAQTWNNVAIELKAVGDEYEQALSATTSWSGDAAIAYRKLAQQYTGSLFQISDQAAGAAQGVTYAGIAVGTMRAIVFDIIATFVSDVIARAIIAAASSAITFGAAIAAFIASLMADLALLMAKIQKKIGKLLQAIQKFVTKFSLLGKNSASAAKALGRKATELGTEANRAAKQATRSIDELAVGAGKRYDDYVKGAANSRVGKVGEPLTGPGARAAKEGLDQIEEQRDQMSGGTREDGKYTPPPTTSGRISGSIADD